MKYETPNVEIIYLEQGDTIFTAAQLDNSELTDKD